MAHSDDTTGVSEPAQTFIRFHAEDHGLLAELPDWIGRDLFDLTDPYPSGSLPVIFEEDFGGPDLDKPFRIAMSAAFSPARRTSGRLVRRSFARFSRPEAKLQRSWTRRCPPLVTRVRQSSRCTLRRADFGHGAFWIAPAGWYLAWLRSIWTQLDQPVLYIATDEVTLIPRFAEFFSLERKEISGICNSRRRFHGRPSYPASRRSRRHLEQLRFRSPRRC